MAHCIVIASGGTGGHLYPTIAVAEEIRKERPDIRIVFIGTNDRIEAREVPRAGFDFFPIDITAPGRSAKSLLRFPVIYFAASRRSRSILSDLSPCAFLGGGAYLSVPVAFAAKSKRIPIALLEINAVPGKANRLLSRIADKIFVAYREAINNFAKAHVEKIEVTGTPVRKSLEEFEMSSQNARSHFGLQEDRNTLLVFGGSLGARSLNEAMINHAEKLINRGFNIIWQTGRSANIKKLLERFPDRRRVAILEYIDAMDLAYAASDLVVSRAGASTLAELATLGKPAILVPYPYAANNHQLHNAKAFEETGAAIVITDHQIDSLLEDKVVQLMSDTRRLGNMAENMRKRENKDGRKVVAQWLIAHCTS